MGQDFLDISVPSEGNAGDNGNEHPGERNIFQHF